MVERTKLLDSAINCDINGLYECLCRKDDIRYKNSSGINLLMYAIIFGTGKKNKKEYIDYLLTNGVNINSKKVNGDTALHLACMKSDLEMVKHLLKSGAYLNVVDEYGYNELMNACRMTFRKFPEEMKKLNIGPDVSYVDGAMKIIAADKDKTTQILADQIEIMKILLDCGIYKEQISIYGDTAMDLAINNSDIETTLMVNLLKSYGVPVNQDYKKSFNIMSSLADGGIAGFMTESKRNNLRKMKIKAIIG